MDALTDLFQRLDALAKRVQRIEAFPFTFAYFRARRTATSTTMRTSDTYIGITDTSAPRTITLLDPATLMINRVIVINDETVGAGSNITIQSNGGKTIDGAANYVLGHAINGDHIHLISDGVNWFSW